MTISRSATSQQITKPGRKVGGPKKKVAGRKRPRGVGQGLASRNKRRSKA